MKKISSKLYIKSLYIDISKPPIYIYLYIFIHVCKEIIFIQSSFSLFVSLQSYLRQNNFPLGPECSVTGDVLE